MFTALIHWLGLTGLNIIIVSTSYLQRKEMSTSVPPVLTAAATPTPHSSSPSTCWWPSSPSSATDASFASSASRPPSTRRPTRLWLPWRRQTRPWGPTSRSTSRSTLTCRTSAAWRRVWRGKTLVHANGYLPIMMLIEGKMQWLHQYTGEGDRSYSHTEKISSKT